MAPSSTWTAPVGKEMVAPLLTTPARVHTAFHLATVQNRGGSHLLCELHPNRTKIKQWEEEGRGGRG